MNVECRQRKTKRCKDFLGRVGKLDSASKRAALSMVVERDQKGLENPLQTVAVIYSAFYSAFLKFIHQNPLPRLLI
jgi:hypothetical protein